MELQRVMDEVEGVLRRAGEGLVLAREICAALGGAEGARGVVWRG